MPAGRCMFRRSLGRNVLFLVLMPGSLGLLACGAFSSTGQRAVGRARVEPRDTRLVHEECSSTEAGAAEEDINGDGRPDRRTHEMGARGRCRTLDFNFDGVIDAWVYLDGVGQVRRRENDYDRDGSVDEVSLYTAGVLVEQQRATTRAGKLDTWHYFTAGRVARTERDSNGDDYIDQWWEYPEQRSPDCPLVHSDVNGDGQPDPGATVDLCRNRYGAAAEQAPDATRTGALSEPPTEITPASDADAPAGESNAPAGPAGAP